MPVRLKNNARGLLAVSVTALDTVIRVRVGQGNRFPLLGDDEWFPLILEDEQGNIEITRAISISGDAITVMRAQDGTQARAFPADTLVSLRLTPAAIRSWFNGEDPSDEEEGDPDYGGTGLIFNGLIVNAYHTEQGRQGYFHPNSGTSEGQFVFAGACYMAAEAIQDYIEDHQPVPEGMTVTGSLPDYVPGAAYEGRLQINNSIGVCTVEQIAGDALPPGSRIRVDNYRKEVVIDWPAYAELPGDPLPNGDFEKGDQDWIKGPGWSIEPTGNGNDGHGARVAVYRGYGESVLESQAFTPCEPGLSFPVKVNVQQGASAAGNAGAGIGMRYYSAQDAGSKVGEQFGNQIWSGAKGRWHWSNLDAVVPAGANFMRAVIVGGRKRENKPLWVDDANWSIPTVIGTNDDDQEFWLRLLVRDSTGQEATWEGVIGYGTVYLTSRLYPIDAPFEHVILSPSIIGFVHKNSVVPADVDEPTILLSPSIVGFVHKDQPKVYPEEPPILLSPTITGFIHKDQPKATVEEPAISLSPTITGFVHKTHPNPTVEEPAILLSPTITGFIHG